MTKENYDLSLEKKIVADSISRAIAVLEEDIKNCVEDKTNSVEKMCKLADAFCKVCEVKL